MGREKGDLARNKIRQSLKIRVDAETHRGSLFVQRFPSENLFIVRDGELLEPETTSALDGITRRTVSTLAREAGLSVRAKRLTRDEVYCADEVFFTGTAAEITPVVEVDARRIGNGQPGPITRRLQQAYFAAVRGEDERHDDWLTPAT